ncbi:hypothetical protein DTL42_06905 [Bremerella cremea]|uniref:Uncharacterized protein n=1 Tax=Bremerella cremea TaxID=1031537 RepID=A0A368KWY0_9BACT|nr:hypothetical protein DTL42_06905 [Bremerella cremea]
MVLNSKYQRGQQQNLTSESFAHNTRRDVACKLVELAEKWFGAGSKEAIGNAEAYLRPAVRT